MKTKPIRKSYIPDKMLKEIVDDSKDTFYGTVKFILDVSDEEMNFRTGQLL